MGGVSKAKAHKYTSKRRATRSKMHKATPVRRSRTGSASTKAHKVATTHKPVAGAKAKSTMARKPTAGPKGKAKGTKKPAPAAKAPK
jgi:hypothetical protein